MILNNFDASFLQRRLPFGHSSQVCVNMLIYVSPLMQLRKLDSLHWPLHSIFPHQFGDTIMCLTASVGLGGQNRPIDVKTVQMLINMNIGAITPIRVLGIDGRAGSHTNSAIGEFQSRLLGFSKPDRRVDPNGKTLAKLREGIPETLTIEVLQGIMPNASAADLKLYRKHLIHSMRTRNISTPLRQAHFLAQVAHESGAFRYTRSV